MKALKAAAIAAAAALYGCTATTGGTAVAGAAERGSAAGAQALSYAAPEAPAKGFEAIFAHQTARVRTDCFPDELKAILADLHEEFGRKPVVTSGHRPRAGTSQHAGCNAADIRIPGVKPSRIAKYARTIDGIGGVGTYSRTGIVHVDVGPRRDWHY